MKQDRKFFVEKKSWSKTKDDLLSAYLVPYFAKISMRAEKLIYFDGFSGPGLFHDGSSGSPLIALGIYDKHVKEHNPRYNDAAFFFSEKKADYRASLEEAIGTRMHAASETAVFASYEENLAAVVDAARTTSKHLSAFFYIDPFGIIDLDFGHIKTIRNNITSSEILLNFCSPGLLREMFCVKKINGMVPKDVEYGNEMRFEGSDEQRTLRLDRILGGNWWLEMAQSHKSGTDNYWDLEKAISDRYRQNAANLYTYVISMPITIPGSKTLKYRMMHMTNHPDGCITMNDNMIVRKRHHNPQSSLFDEDIDGELLGSSRDDEIQQTAEKLVATMPFDRKIQLGVIIAKLISATGVTYRSSELGKRFIAPFEHDGVIQRADPHANSSSWSNNRIEFIRRRMGS
ncbi:three-Cys-motif partner protein TcmP [Raoultibacter phocaeensis]|uniref:three-Cys-motif partner protein TcmP n=1 Tax=Raoultibacter phocaeensis TaxID=2479841 RepID=UPI0015D61378|nr:three-Cys-motif partner protein TcmP [Raoultibacter phocaeensis]